MHQLCARILLIVLFLSGVADLWAQAPTELRPARIGAVYALALDTNRPAKFEKSGGNAEWLRVTEDGILTGKPDPDAPPASEITVTARALAADGNIDTTVAPLTRAYLVRVIANPCAAADSDPLAWCDAQATTAAPPPAPSKAAPPPSPGSRFAFSPLNLFNLSQFRRFATTGKPILLLNSCPGANGCVVQFHRLRGENGEFGSFDSSIHNVVWSNEPLTGTLGEQIIDAINGSKVFISGSVLVYEQVDSCANWSWSVVTQSMESSNNLVYPASDMTYFCVDGKKGVKGTILLVLPVHVIWAAVYASPAQFKDPAWKLPSKPPTAHDCMGNPVGPGQQPQMIRPCDANPNPWLRHGFGWFYSRLALPGVSQGGISIAPIMATTKSTWDVQLYGSTLLGPGWVGFQFMYEHDRKTADDLNSLTAALTYDVRFSRQPNFWAEWGSVKAQDHGEQCGPGVEEDCTPPYLGLRPLELNLRFGPEWSPDAFSYTPKYGSTTAGTAAPNPEVTQYLPRDLNLVGAATLRLPIIVSPSIFGPRVPSQFSIAPVGGFEAGRRMISNGIETAMACPVPEPPQCEQPQTIFRRVGGFDASARWPYNFTKNFLGDRPLTVDYSYRIRWLTHAEPFSDQDWMIKDNNMSAEIKAENLQPPTWPLLVPLEGQSLGARIYQRITFIAPFSAYLQLRVTWQHGSLPPAFQYVGNQVTVGFTFSNPGSVEH